MSEYENGHSLIDGLDEIHYNDLLNEQHPSCYIVNDELEVLISRTLTLNENSLGTISNGYIIKNNTIYKFDREKEFLEEFNNGFKSLYKELDRDHTKNKHIIESYKEEVDKLEDFLFERDVPRFFMDMWFDMRKSFSRIDRYYERTLSVLREFVKKNEGNKKFSLMHFNDLIQEIQFNVSNVKSQLNRLDGLHNYYSSIKSDKLNENIFLLTILSAVFLPLNLIVGFFGMNTEGLFFKEQPDATLRVVYILLGITVVLLLGIRLVKLIDKYFLQFIFRKYSFYKNFKNKVESFDKRFKINE